ncbi:MAG: hypothetical protein GTN78_19400 [Gemmatimonadales bacterium]|nr:hypothetical protein [Gemmatimonadales bacterium]NIS66127.1 hypothetical protein [Gemmatimonadales bacterium]
MVVAFTEADALLPPVVRNDVGQSIADLLFLKLADVGPELNTVDPSTFVPELAESWTFEDDRTITFTLHPEARWQDGTPVTADDVVFTYEVYRDSLVASNARPRILHIESVTARDSRTVVFRFPKPYAEQFFDAVNHLRIIPRHLLGTVPRADLVAHPFGRNPVGNGPFRFVQWRAGESIELVADSTFFLGRPGLRRIIWRVAGDPSTAVTQLLAGEADALNYIPPDAVERVAESEHLQVVDYPSTYYSYVAFNLRDPDDHSRPHPLFRDRSLRRALSMAVNREQLVQAVDGETGIVARGPVTPAFWIWDEEYELLPFDSAQARRQLTQVGWQDADGDGVLDRGGRRLAFDLLVPITSASRRRAAQVIQEQLKRLGVEVSINELDFGAFRERGEAHRFDMFFGSYGGDPSPATIAEVWTGDGSGNYGSYVNQTVDRLVRDALDARDVATARAKWRQAVNLIVQDAPAIWTSVVAMRAGVHQRFENVSLRGDNWAATLWEWRVPPDRQIDRDRFTITN